MAHHEDVLSSPKSDRVRKVATLATAKTRRREGLFLAEGPQPVREALRAWLERYEEPGSDAAAERRSSGSYKPELDALYFDPQALERHSDVETLLDRVRGVLFDPQANLPSAGRVFLREAAPEVLEAMGDAETSQGIIAVCRIPQAQHIPEGSALVAGLMQVQDPGNVGTIIRAADAAGADAVVLSAGSVDPWSPKVVRSAAGSHFHLPLITGADAARAAEEARRSGLQVLAADGRGEISLEQMTRAAGADADESGGKERSAEARHEPRASAPTMWLFGNEAHGLGEAERGAADSVVSIPMYGQAESLNVAAAAAVCLYTSAMAQR